MTVQVLGRVPKVFGVTQRELRKAAELFASFSSRRVNGKWQNVIVRLVRDAESDELHQAIIGVSGATDVITQAYDSMPGEPEGLYGELFVNTDQARRAVPKREGWSLRKELLLYIAHGMDHLSGADDHSEGDYQRMRRRELSWIKRYETIG